MSQEFKYKWFMKKVSPGGASERMGNRKGKSEKPGVPDATRSAGL